MHLGIRTISMMWQLLHGRQVFPAVYSEGYKCGGIRIQRIDEHATINLCI